MSDDNAREPESAPDEPALTNTQQPVDADRGTDRPTTTTRAIDVPRRDHRPALVPAVAAALLFMVALTAFWLSTPNASVAGSGQDSGTGSDSREITGQGTGSTAVDRSSNRPTGSESSEANQPNEIAVGQADTGEQTELGSSAPRAHDDTDPRPASTDAGEDTGSDPNTATPLPALGFRSDLTAAPPPAPPTDEPTPTPAAAFDPGQRGNAGVASFFGQAGHGSRFVFIIDRSGSMRGDAFEAALFELTRSLRTLRAHESFFVIFYDRQALPMPAANLLPATPANVERVIEWTRQVSTGGGTNPTEALVLALSELDPDTIWLLSDGKFGVRVTDVIQQHNPEPRTHINTIAFLNRGGETVLKMIADQNDGDYKFVARP